MYERVFNLPSWLNQMPQLGVALGSAAASSGRPVSSRTDPRH